MLFALWFYAGGHKGEACGLKWSGLDPRSAAAARHEDEPLKTNRPRKVPVHPELAAVLDDWWRHGFELSYALRPTSAD